MPKIGDLGGGEIEAKAGQMMTRFAASASQETPGKGAGNGMEMITISSDGKVGPLEP